ncbi:keto-deoxy-phosphogluconate aldolase [Ahniella affigens]|uniref:2-dehydro-3-deoxy-phosphogluconate aldolase n=1 Tax=Ahniella affigens TaxID=2021234 RepID=A0A2P1PML0_9GAMM|nr:bifunctional 4-hydroxy-2-oxoglutarate aldolase/2-dehydro-3-deoxy-phosphogluconate aldolase [Ahniella affigens]AVP96083.1 keto-deoxy-phosphogluconate aldolase [Ahniella affigens]
MPFTSIQARTDAVDAILTKAPVVPVIAIQHLDDAIPLARALVQGGLPVLEITLRTEAALPAMRAIAEAVPGAIVGAGTVLNPDDLHNVVATGAQFAISPGATEALYQAAAGIDMPWIPAIATASELMQGLTHGHRRFKFFPAESAGGVAALKSLHGPFPQAKFCPTGGIDPAKAPAYLALPNVITIGGSWMLPADALASRDFARIEALARATAAIRG